MPEGARKVARPTGFGNPFTVKGAIEHGFADNDAEARQVAVAAHRRWLLRLDPGDRDVYLSENGKHRYDRGWVLRCIGNLRGRDLACYCPPDQPCHADLLLELANATETPDA